MRDWTPRVAPLFLRVLLGAVFLYAGVQKLLTPGFFDPRSPTSINAQMAYAAHTSPIHALVAPLVPHAGLLGHVIAFGEVAVSVSALLGLFTRLAAIGGVALSLSFWLTVNAHVHPIYFVPDFPWAALWALLWMVGPGEYLAAENHFTGNRPQPAPLTAPRAQRPPGSQQHIWPGDNEATWQYERPVWPEHRMPLVSRRQALQLGGAAGGLIAVVVISLRVMHRGPFAPSAGYSPSFTPDTAGTAGQASASTGSSSSPASSGPASVPRGQEIGTVAQLGVGGWLQFTHRGQPAVAVRPSPTSYRGYSLVCTHAGCIVDRPAKGKITKGETIVCRCHNSVFSAADGSVRQGPAPTSLPPIIITATDGKLYAS